MYFSLLHFYYKRVYSETLIAICECDRNVGASYPLTDFWHDSEIKTERVLEWVVDEVERRAEFDFNINFLSSNLQDVKLHWREFSLFDLYNILKVYKLWLVAANRSKMKFDRNVFDGLNRI